MCSHYGSLAVIKKGAVTKTAPFLMDTALRLVVYLG